MDVEQGKIMQQKAQGATTVLLKFTGYNGLLKVCTVLSAKLWQVFLLVEGPTTVHIYARPFSERVTVHLCARCVVVSRLCRVVQDL